MIALLTQVLTKDLTVLTAQSPENYENHRENRPIPLEMEAQNA